MRENPIRSPVLASADNLVPLILELRDETEAGRRIAEPIVRGLKETRLCRTGVCKELAGLELSIAQTLPLYETLSGAEASVAWIVWNNSLPALLARYLTPTARGEIFADPDWLYANSTRPSGRAESVADGYRINGRWSLVSGCEIADWFMLACLLVKDGEVQMTAPSVPEQRLVFVERDDVEIIDTWHVGGLRGTGSHDVAIDDLVVSRAFSFSPADPITIDKTIGRVPIFCTMTAGLAAQAIGVAQRALDTLTELAKTKASPGQPALKERASVQAAISGHGAALGAARAYLSEQAEAIWGKVESGTAATPMDIGLVHCAALNADRAARETVDAMYEAGGTSSLYTSSPLERAHRDLHAMMRHIAANPSILEDAGSVTLGLPPKSPVYAL